jgi:ABC-2 type transport system ATP-binding protein
MQDAASGNLAVAQLEVRQLTKKYGTHTALHALDLMLGPRWFVALLGPNGAGKTTLFQVLTGLFAADSGDVVIAGCSLRNAPSAALAHVGVVFQQMSLDLDLSSARNLQFHADLHGLPRGVAHERITQGLAAFGLTADAHRAVRELSGGNRRKVELARALLHRPTLLLMDEPTVGLDPQSRRDLLQAIRRDVADRGTTVLWATHLVEEAHDAGRVLVLHRGRLLADGTPDEVAAALGGGTLEEGFIAATSRRSPAASQETSR